MASKLIWDRQQITFIKPPPHLMFLMDKAFCCFTTISVQTWPWPHMKRWHTITRYYQKFNINYYNTTALLVQIKIIQPDKNFICTIINKSPSKFAQPYGPITTPKLYSSKSWQNQMHKLDEKLTKIESMIRAEKLIASTKILRHTRSKITKKLN